MAGFNDKEIKLLISSKSNTIGFKEAEKALRDIKLASKDFSKEFGADAQVIGQRYQTIVDKGKTIRVLDAVLQNSNGQITKWTGRWREAAGQIVANSSVYRSSVVDLNKLSESTKSAGINLGGLIQRAALTIPVWFLLRSAITAVTSSITGAIKFFIEFEAQLAQIQIVGDSTKGEIDSLGRAILNLSSSFGVSSKDVAEAAVTLIQQGKTISETISTLDAATKFSIASSRSLADTIEDLTAIQKSYNFSASETGRITDAITNVQLKFAISTADLAKGLKRLSPVASELGLTFQQTIGLITAVQGQTRKSGDEVANSLKTILSRIQGDVLLTIQQIANIPTFLDDNGGATTEFTGRARALNDILSDLAITWNTLTDSEKSNLAVVLAGRHRISDFLALMNNFKEGIDATTEAFFSNGASMEASNIILQTAQNRILRLGESWKKFSNEFRDEFQSVVNPTLEGFISLLNNVDPGQFAAAGLGGLSGIVGNTPESLSRTARSSTDAFVQDSIKSQETIDALNNVLDAYQNLRKERERLESLISRSDDPIILDKAKSDLDSLGRTFAQLFNQKTSKAAGFVLSSENVNDIDKVLAENLNKIISLRLAEQSKIDISSNLRKATELTSERSALNLNSDIGKQRELEINSQLAQLNRDSEKIANTLNDRTKEQVDLIKATLFEKRKVFDVERDTQAILEKLKNFDEEQLNTGKAQSTLLRDRLTKIRQLAKEAGLIGTDGNILPGKLRNEDRNTRNGLNRLEEQEKLNTLQQAYEISLIKASSNGETDIQIQARRVGLAQVLAQRTGDQNKVLEEQLKLQTLIAEKAAGISRDLQSSFNSSFKDLLKGESTIDQFFTSIGDKMTDQVASSLSNVFTNNLFQGTGFGDAFGSILGGFENKFGGITQAHLDGFTQGSQLLENTFNKSADVLSKAIFDAVVRGLNTAQGGKPLGQGQDPLASIFQKGGGGTSPFASVLAGINASKNGKAGLTGGFTSIGGIPVPNMGDLGDLSAILKKQQTGLIGSLSGIFNSVKGFGGNILGGLSGGAGAGGGAGLFGSLGGSIGGLAGGALSKGISAIPYVGAIASIGFSLFNLFKGFRTKRTVQVQESEKELQVASKIDVTNKKLDVVNRNLIALKQTFEVFVLPTSAAFAEKRSLEDNFSLNARRGLA